MAINSELFIPRNNFFYRLDPISKIIMAITLTLSCFFITSILGLCLFFMAIILFFLIIQIPQKEIWTILKVLLPLSLIIIICWPLFQKDFYQALKDKESLSILTPLLAGGVISALRLLSLCLSSFLVLFTIDQTALIAAFVRLGLPYSIGLSVSLALRFIPTLYTLFEQVKIAQKARGFDIDEHRGLKKIKTFMPILIAVIVSSLKMSEDLSYALDTRGLGLHKKNSSYRVFHLRAIDMALITLCILVQISLILSLIV